MRVSSYWLGSTGNAGTTDLGSVVFGLRRAVIALEADGDVKPLVTMLKPNAASNGKSYANGVVMFDDPQQSGRWTVDPVEGDMLLGDIYLEQLATVWHDPKNEMVLKVVADSDWIELNFRPSGVSLGNERAKSDARKHLIEKVLRLALSDGGETLAFSKADVNLDQRR